MSEEKTQVCPYDSNHIIRISRFEYHLIKCKKNAISKTPVHMDACPFNSKHVVPRTTFRNHMENCPDRFRLGYESALRAYEPELTNSASNSVINSIDNAAASEFENGEDWDEEIRLERQQRLTQPRQEYHRQAQRNK